MTNSYALVHDAQALVSNTRVDLIHNEQYGNRFKKIASGTYADITALVQTLNEGEALIQSLQEQLATAQQVSDVYESTLKEAEVDFQAKMEHLGNTLSEAVRQIKEKSEEVGDLLTAIDGDATILEEFDRLQLERKMDQEDSE